MSPLLIENKVLLGGKWRPDSVYYLSLEQHQAYEPIFPRNLKVDFKSSHLAVVSFLDDFPGLLTLRHTNKTTRQVSLPIPNFTLSEAGFNQASIQTVRNHQLFNSTLIYRDNKGLIEKMYNQFLFEINRRFNR